MAKASGRSASREGRWRRLVLQYWLPVLGARSAPTADAPVEPLPNPLVPAERSAPDWWEVSDVVLLDGGSSVVAIPVTGDFPVAGCHRWLGWSLDE
ncbi:MAG: hypothetical protein WKF73_21585 [Nocardioidaceae bacterium]